MRFRLSLLALFAWAAPASAHDADPTWLNKSVTVTNADMLSLYSNIFTALANTEIDRSTGIVRVEVMFVDADGDTHFDLLFRENMIAKIQKEPPGQQTAELRKIHAQMLAMLTKNPSGKSGMFKDHENVTTPADDAISDFLASRQADDLVVSIGFAHDGTNHLYATVHGDRVDFNPDAPVASDR